MHPTWALLINVAILCWSTWVSEVPPSPFPDILVISIEGPVCAWFIRAYVIVMIATHAPRFSATRKDTGGAEAIDTSRHTSNHYCLPSNPARSRLVGFGWWCNKTRPHSFVGRALLDCVCIGAPGIRSITFACFLIIVQPSAGLFGRLSDSKWLWVPRRPLPADHVLFPNHRPLLASWLAASMVCVSQQPNHQAYHIDSDFVLCVFHFFWSLHVWWYRSSCYSYSSSNHPSCHLGLGCYHRRNDMRARTRYLSLVLFHSICRATHCRWFLSIKFRIVVRMVLFSYVLCNEGMPRL